MSDPITGEDAVWLANESLDFSLRPMKKNARCIVPDCRNMASGKFQIIDVATRFSSVMYMCERCAKALTNDPPILDINEEVVQP